jgi:hypothetical protein
MPHPRIWFDANAGIDGDDYSLDCTGTKNDLAAQRIVLTEGMSLTLYMEDEDDCGRATLLLVDAIVERRERCGLVARIDPGTWRHEMIKQA